MNPELKKKPKAKRLRRPGSRPWPITPTRKQVQQTALETMQRGY